VVIEKEEKLVRDVIATEGIVVAKIKNSRVYVKNV